MVLNRNEEEGYRDVVQPLKLIELPVRTSEISPPTSAIRTTL